MKAETICFDDLIIDFSKKEMQGNGMSGNGIELPKGFNIEHINFSLREMSGNGIK